jgi:hypothetical protein
MRRIVEALATVFAVCVTVRVCALLVAPLLPLLSVVLIVVIAASLLLVGPGSGIGRSK